MSSFSLQFLLLTVAGWMTRDQRSVTEYLIAENRVLREQLSGKRFRFTDAQRRRLAIAAKKLGRKALLMIDTLVSQRHCSAGTGSWWRRSTTGALAAGLADRGSRRTSWS